MHQLERLQSAFDSPDAGRHLNEVARQLVSEGLTQDQMLSLYSAFCRGAEPAKYF